MNAWKIPPAVEDRIRKRDKHCVYCHIKMKRMLYTSGSPNRKATIEHINNNDLRPWNTLNIVMCCGRCNTSKRDKKLLQWFETDYCKKRKISRRTVAAPVKKWLGANDK